MNTTDSGTRATAVAKGRERYVIVWNEASRSEALRTLGRWASNPELSFDWDDAARAASEIEKYTTGGGA